MLVLVRPTLNPADTKYYVVGRSGGNRTVLKSDLTPAGTIAFDQSVGAAAVTPNGQQLLVVSGNLKIYNTQDDSEVRTQSLDVGLNPNDIAITADSTRAFVMSAQGQKITAVDLTTNTIVGSIPLPTIISGSAAMGPNGMLYVSAESRVLEIDPRATPFDTTAVRRQITFAGAKLTKLQFTPDGIRAIAGNLAPAVSGQALVYFSLDLLNSQIQTAIVAPTDAFSGFLFDKICVAGNDRAYAITAGTSAQSRKMFQLILPLPPLTGALQPPVITEPVFGSLGGIPIVDSIAFTPEYPQAQRMYVGAPLKLLEPNAQNTIYEIKLANNNRDAPTPVPSLGPLIYAGPATTAWQEPPSGFIPINATQKAVALSGSTLPFGVRVLSGSGRPIFGVPVTFTPTTAGVTLLGTATATSNHDGIAMITAQGPAAAGSFNIAVSIGSSGLSTSFGFTAGDTGGGGGGGGGGQLIVVEGDGQGIPEGNEGKDIRIRLLDSAGAPVVGSPVTWTVTQGQSRFTLGTITVEENGRATTTTDSKGESIMRVRAQIVENTRSSSQNVISVVAGGQTATLSSISLLATSGGSFAPFPSVHFQAPSEQGGRTHRQSWPNTDWCNCGPGCNLHGTRTRGGHPERRDGG